MSHNYWQSFPEILICISLNSYNTVVNISTDVNVKNRLVNIGKISFYLKYPFIYVLETTL